ncbi:hypothetical protein, variant [Verruconis gallopava]|uniref:tRNA (guanine(37)-N1)-methyltransferase n=1 Tax=Verruconis gallopava TaxID=253628 RepID=A0A0D2AME9_9PEZI|nr:uncharacterized protein PV09_01583 [Verruconis gallopava]XP_016217509.1 hypothetical protein, variant [Verruconis gallopava]KIW07639.1 hypothetical protein PV09_01583 [Verruconis gallopava]KIW07640.1 hypothetical protein, variant [Verruconis gallopava]
MSDVNMLLRPPVNRAMRQLDRAFFQKTVPLAAARIFSNQQISQCRKDLEKSRDLLRHERISPIQLAPGANNTGLKCLLLKPNIKHDDVSTWSETLRALETSKKVDVIPYELQLNYDSWDYYDIMTSVLPEDEQEEVPSGFSIIGHVAHLNLRSQYLPYKSLIASVLLDKNPQVRTVINKIDDVGAENPFRTFPYEVLAGPNDLNVEVKEEDCLFRFDYAKVYWNPRLHSEHKRLVSLFSEGEAVCDVMAGVGPFAVPAGRKRVFVWANDLNPDSYASLEDAIKRNKVSQYVRPFSTDGRRFIVDATRDLYHATKQHKVEIFSKPSRSSKEEKKLLKTLIQPRYFSHYVMNLPASALSFLTSFVGVYRAADIPQTLDARLPKIHVYCFSTKSEDNVEEEKKICAEITGLLGREMRPGSSHVEGEVEIVDVRDVAPNKRMFCASFTLPSDVAWARPMA